MLVHDGFVLLLVLNQGLMGTLAEGGKNERMMVSKLKFTGTIIDSLGFGYGPCQCMYL